MTELMKRYCKENSCCHTTISAYGLTMQTPAYVAWLEAQLTWRPVSEKPEKDGEYLVKDSWFCEVLKYEKDKWHRWDVEVCEWFIEILYGDEEWLPIPLAPEGE